MPYFICVGDRGTGSRTKYGLKSRGYHIYRRGCEVHAWWGAVAAQHRGRLGIKMQGIRTWIGLRPRRFATPERASAYLAQRVEQLESSVGGYHRLPPGTRIQYQRGYCRKTPINSPKLP